MSWKRNLLFFITAMFFGSQVIIFLRYDGTEGHKAKQSDDAVQLYHPPKATEPPGLDTHDRPQNVEDEDGVGFRPKIWWTRARGAGGGGHGKWFVTGTAEEGDSENPVVTVCRRSVSSPPSRAHKQRYL